jgi:AraC family transcriptional regulator of adaptative response/methylated-DNA-[protein]-cysteine methyltransferase
MFAWMPAFAGTTVSRIHMIKPTQQKEYYQALLDKNPDYEGIFYVGVKTTGVFCRPTCPARKPKFEHCEFFKTAEQALIASFRACKRCKPLSHPNQVSTVIQQLVDAVETNPEKRWKAQDFKELNMEAATASRHFKKRFGMTFVAYGRARRMGLAMKQIRKGEPIIEAQLSAGYESSSGFRDAFSRIMGAAPTLAGQHTLLKTTWLDSPLGPMLTIVDETHLHLLEFVERRGLEREIERLRKRLKAAILPGRTPITDLIEKELKLYFKGQLQIFKTPLFYLGSEFQKQVWEALIKIPYGKTKSYQEQAIAIGKPTAFRAVANANGCNQIAIVIPCHRIINTNGELGGYGGGVARKAWLLEHERKYKI